MQRSTLYLVTTNVRRVRRSKDRGTSLMSEPKSKDDLQADQIQLQARYQRLLVLFAARERAHYRYLTFYETSPVSYVSLDQDAMILGINLTGALKSQFPSLHSHDLRGTKMKRFLLIPSAPSFDSSAAANLLPLDGPGKPRESLSSAKELQKLYSFRSFDERLRAAEQEARVLDLEWKLTKQISQQALLATYSDSGSFTKLKDTLLPKKEMPKFFLCGVSIVTIFNQLKKKCSQILNRSTL
jgi:hypothetical protein